MIGRLVVQKEYRVDMISILVVQKERRVDPLTLGWRGEEYYKLLTA